ncbi:PQQ-dependent sugar dehydrogenase [Marinilongibacter aquaticus]|uniref:PVC-type heme-binding CxxCH protein n=1 Tax=Marinilongibacter aquaticus TaxID=2975157 RepID=UPI0021BD77E4|nr:PVC-type heme-binding CxxCH protein [Marinilongibacter aquaticus]UBM58824.1 PQQ-dependent sugar dehydrogenase [Marinilongibacter aquaticus]
MRKILSLLGISIALYSCNQSHQKLSNEEYAALSDEQKRSAEYALEGIALEDKDLEVTLFASEPMMLNPTDMDIDDRGRVWICEGYNYRNKLNPRNPYDDKGDRILILEDTNGDGKADTSKVFYQGEDINSALGIGVFGNRVIVSRSPYVFVFTDEDGDDVPDKKEIMFEGIGGEQHDHGMHAFTFGPDGKFYFNYGNAGEGMLTKDGKPLYDSQGRIIRNDGKPYREGMVYRSDLNGENVEILAWNFRNNYEVTVDSYGRVWQSDNDDDGNRGTRINFVMDYGNYGFKDEMTGADWRTRRVGMNDSIPLRHWHLNDPGVVPNMLQTFAGSPTGITVYEGENLPSKYQGQLLHTDAGPNIFRSYAVKEDGAGFTASISNILNGNYRDNWFRPSDVTVAPDGSVFVSDWYDPGVGGHAMGDPDRGRIYRVTSKKHAEYTFEKADYSTVEGNIKALQSPNTATRYNAWINLHDMGEDAEEALLELWKSSNPIMRARAFWLLTKIPGKGDKYVREAAKDADENIRVAAVRASRELADLDFSGFYMEMAEDASPQVRREVAEAIRYTPAKEIWLKLAQAYDGKDRWYLEALGIAAEGYWDTYLPAYIKQAGDNWLQNEAAKNIVWRSRSAMTLGLLGKIIESQKEDNIRFFRAMDFQKGDKNSVLFSLLDKSPSEEVEVTILKMLEIKNLEAYPKLEGEIKSLFGKVNDEDFLELAKKYPLEEDKSRLLELIRKSEEGKIINEAAHLFVAQYGLKEVKEMMYDADESKAINATERFGVIDSEPVTDMLVGIFQNTKLPLPQRQMAMEAMNGWESEARLWEMIKKDEVPEDVMDIAKKHMLGTWHTDIRAQAATFFGNDKTDNTDVSKLVAQKGDAKKGQEVFETYCTSCHIVKGKGTDFGPALSQIGSKLSKAGLYNAILNPSEGMGFGYETQKIIFTDGSEVLALVNSKTENELIVKLPGMSEQTRYPLKEVKSVEELKTSLMPKFPLEEEQLINLVEYLGELK